LSNYSVLVASHSFVVDTNREVWNSLASQQNIVVDALLPKRWTSNLIKKLNYKYNSQTDQHFTQIHALPVFFSGKASFFIFQPFKLFCLLKSKKYDRILLAQETWCLCLLSLTVIKWLTCNRKTKVDLWVCQNIKKKNLYWMRFWERLNTINVSSILHCCQEIKEVIDWKGIQIPCRYFPFSFNPTKYQENFEYNEKSTRDYLTIGHLGRLSEEKGISQLLKAVEKLQEEDHSLYFKIAGGGPLDQVVQGFCQNHPRRKYLGLLPHNKAHLFYRDLNIFLLTSQTRSYWKEQFGRVIVEAIASGCGFVGSNSGAIPEVMGKLKSLHIYQENNLEDLIVKSREALSDIESHDYLQRKKERHQLAMDAFSHEAVATIYTQYLNQDLQ
jgi:glycosyltransferase involved in cell wall biosynthesis